MTDNILVLVDEAAALKESIEAQTERLREINQELASQAEFKDGAKTGHISGTFYTAKVQLKENVKWDQAALETMRAKVGDSEFFKVFKWTFEPKSAKVLAGALEFGQHKEMIEAARTVTPGAPSVSFEKLESC